MKYIVIKKDTGKIFEKIMYDDTSVPVNEQVLAYVPITSEMEEALTTHEKVIDYNQTKFINGSWQAVIYEPEKNDILADRTRDKNTFIAEANRKLLIPDASPTFKTRVQDYIAKLNAITPTSNVNQEIVWPVKPW